MYRLEDMPSYSPITVNPDWHDTQTIQLGELMAAGFDPYGDPDWTEAGWPDDATRQRVENKITRHFKYCEISVTPPGKWRDIFTARALDVVPKYAPLYRLFADGVNPLYAGDTWTKNRSLFSDFPATRLNPATEDYASNATDFQEERVDAGNLLDQLAKFRDYRDVDLQLVDEFHTLFTELATPTVEW